SVGVPSGVSVKAGVSVAVGGMGVDVLAPAVWVNMTIANSIAAVPIASTGTAVACGAHDASMKAAARVIIVVCEKTVFIWI
ncbi:MAG: hypothetical protein Q8M03_01975, partial [Legionella sp.]|nr:hypothetical protein [Legionella sp.]